MKNLLKMSSNTDFTSKKCSLCHNELPKETFFKKNVNTSCYRCSQEINWCSNCANKTKDNCCAECKKIEHFLKNPCKCDFPYYENLILEVLYKTYDRDNNQSMYTRRFPLVQAIDQSHIKYDNLIDPDNSILRRFYRIPYDYIIQARVLKIEKIFSPKT